MTPWLGRHSFHAFTHGEGRLADPNCTVDQAHWNAQDGRLILTLSANRFLYRMVRTLVAILMKAHQQGELESSVMARLVTPDAVRPQVVAAPARGLFLTLVEYRDDFPTVTWEDDSGGVE